LSGLLIGAEILAGARGARQATALGSAGLCARYAEAGARLGVEIGAGAEDVALRGLNALRRGAWF
jgi:2-keto-3-deoxy-galactonokinase